MEEVGAVEINLRNELIRFIDSTNAERHGLSFEKHQHEIRFMQIGVESSPFFVIDATFNLIGEAFYLLWEPVGNRYFITRVTEFGNFFYANHHEPTNPPWRSCPPQVAPD